MDAMAMAVRCEQQVFGVDSFIKNLHLRTRSIHGNAQKVRQMIGNVESEQAFSVVLKFIIKQIRKIKEEFCGENRMIFKNLVRELREMLSVVGGYAGLVQIAWERKEYHESKAYIDSMEHASFRSMNLVLDAQDEEGFSLVRHIRDMDTGPYVVNIEDVVNRAVKMSESRRIGDEPYVNILSPVSIHRFAGDIRLILSNIIINAYEAMREKRYGDADHPSLHIYVDVLNGTLIDIAVKDNGVGMSEEVMKKVFLPDYTTKGNKGENGIGLYNCKNILEERMGGELLVKSERNKGTTFNVRFPYFEK